MISLYQRMMGWRWKQQHKHDLGEGWAEDDLNSLTNEELLSEISGNLETMFEELKERLK